MKPNLKEILNAVELELCQKYDLIEPISQLLDSIDWKDEEKITGISKRIQKLIKDKLIIEGNLPFENQLFGIPQGAQFLDLREESARLTMELDFAGYSIGGVANGGEPEEIMYNQVLAQTELLEENKPRHLLGVGTPADIVQMVARGIDMFDCVYPTRNARHGSLICEIDDSNYTIIHIQAARFQFDQSAINPNSVFEELRNYSKSYLCHLFRAKELLAYRLATLNNLEFYLNLMHKIRQKINNDTFDTWYKNYKKIP